MVALNDKALEDGDEIGRGANRTGSQRGVALDRPRQDIDEERLHGKEGLGNQVLAGGSLGNGGRNNFWLGQ